MHLGTPPLQLSVLSQVALLLDVLNLLQSETDIAPVDPKP